MGKLDGKAVLVTGASRGIGKAIAVRLASEGAKVLAIYRTHRIGVEGTVAEISAAGGQAVALQGDIAAIGAVAELVERADAALDGKPLDILVNNAGIGGGGSIAEVEEDMLHALFATNVWGTFLLTKALLPRISNGGRIINISSMVALAAYPKSIAYAMTKAAVNSFTRSLAVELGPRGITVNAVAPGATATDFIAPILANTDLKDFYARQAALGRIGQPNDIAGVAAFLASPDADWVTGQIVEASGGMHL